MLFSYNSRKVTDYTHVSHKNFFNKLSISIIMKLVIINYAKKISTIVIKIGALNCLNLNIKRIGFVFN